jgi:hypothetical protein
VLPSSATVDEVLALLLGLQLLDGAHRLVCGRLQFDCALRRISKVTSELRREQCDRLERVGDLTIAAFTSSGMSASAFLECVAGCGMIRDSHAGC